jgi:hypothetical protein
MPPKEIRQQLIAILQEHQPQNASQLLLAIEQLVIKAIAAEREACAATAEKLGTRWIDTHLDAYNACLGVAGHIRAREGSNS